VLDLALDARRGSFHLKLECSFASEWTVIFGPSGAGKTTLLRLIAGLSQPESGRIVLAGRVLNDSERGVNIKPGERRISMVAQQPALFPHLSVTANVAYGIADLNHSAGVDRVEEMLELVGAKDLATRRPRDLSGGEAQRVALARALAPLPSLLLLDEPFSALDGAASDALLDRLRLWTKEHRTQTVMATHDATDAMAIGAEVALLREGRLAAQGPAVDVLVAERERLLGRIGRT
jgi:ABC-type sulfate/molybdate transport systems ATPase subunit